MSSLVDEIITIVKSEANNNPPPQRCIIQKIYDDNNHADVKTENGVLKFVEVLGSPTLYSDAVLLFFNEELTDYIAICSGGGGGSSGGDLTFEVDLLTNGYMKFVVEIINNEE